MKIKVSTLQELETRIRAKAQERRHHLQCAQQQGPRDDRVWVADAIFSHVRKLLRQRPGGRFRTASLQVSSSQNTKCRVVLSNLMRAVPGYNYQQFVAMMHQFATTCPGWISWRDERISKTTTMTIDTFNYKAVRARLSGKMTIETEQTPQQGLTRPVPVVTISGNKRVSRKEEK